MNPLDCGWGEAQYFIISSNVFDPIIYYSHLLPLALSLFFGGLIFIKDRKSLLNKSLFVVTLLFSIWCFFDLILWASEKSSNIMFFWTLVNMIEPMIYAGLLYFTLVFIRGRDLYFSEKLPMILALLPLIVLAPTQISILGFNLIDCEREVIEGPLVYYGYFVEIIFVLWATITSLLHIRKIEKGDKTPAILVLSGVILFSVIFSLGNIVGSFSENWTIGQYGLFGMPVLIAFLSYLVVKYKTFNVKIIGTQALVFALGILVTGILLVRNIENVRIITSITLVLLMLVGIILIRSVKREVSQREEIETLAEKLEGANAHLQELNEQKTEFISLATHQIRAPLTAIKGYASLVLEGDYGQVSDEVKEAVQTMYQSAHNLVGVVGDYLDISRLELGRMKYDFTKFELKSLVEQLVKELQPNLVGKKLALVFEPKDANDAVPVTADMGKIKQIIGNLIDNAIKYTPEGSIVVSIERKDIPGDGNDKVLISIKDTGIGIGSETIPKLFQRFSRADDAHNTNTLGTGLGLFIVRQMVESHKGRVWVESKGKGTGSQFYIELPTNLEVKSVTQEAIES